MVEMCSTTFLPKCQAGGVLGAVEGRLIAMLEHVPDLTLAFLNEATQAWAEYEYNRKVHSEIGEAPITRFLAGPEVTRPCPGSDALRLAFNVRAGQALARLIRVPRLGTPISTCGARPRTSSSRWSIAPSHPSRPSRLSLRNAVTPSLSKLPTAAHR